MCDEGALDLGSADAVPRHVDDVVDPPSDPIVAIIIPTARVPTDVLVIRDQLGFTVVELKVRVFKSLLVAVDPPQLAGPTLPDGQVSAALPLKLLALSIKHDRLDAKEGQRRRTGLERGGTRKGRDHVTSSLSLPPGIDNRAVLLANVLVVPLPSLGVDGLTNLRRRVDQHTALSTDFSLHALCDVCTIITIITIIITTTTSSSSSSTTTAITIIIITTTNPDLVLSLPG